ncbi:MAG: LacI family transcriptional regulator [Lachnospiraceae bacterium]|nr:LacI family transcriptional regulator [Lachnospiraceae bacterium]
MITIKDVAKEAGVSPSTVSIILNGKCAERKISDATQNAVRTAMKKLGYIPNISAGKLKGGSPERVIALFWTLDYRDIMLARFLKGLQAEITKKKLNYKIEIIPYKNDELSHETALASVADFHAAIIANAGAADMEFLKGLNPLIPIVLYNRKAENYGGVYIDDAEIAKASYSVLKDCKRVTVVDVPHAFPGMAVRDRKLTELLGKAHLATVYSETNNAEGGYNVCEKIDFKKTDAIYTPSDMIALGILNYAYKNNIKVPQDVKLLSIGNGLVQMDEYIGPGLSTIDIPLEEMAGKCLSLLTDELNGKPAKSIKVKPKTVLRGTI